MEFAERLPISVLDQYKEADKETCQRLYQEIYQNFQHKIVVLDDDPTGCQTVSDIPVYTDPNPRWLKNGMEDPGRMFFLLTNSRSFSAGFTEEYHQRLGKDILDAAKAAGEKVLILSRGDSTLRGHYPLELEALREVWEAETGKKVDGQIICPFFQEGGRYTVNSIHYVKEGEWLVPAGKTEFAGDKTFGYRSSHLGDYVAEKSGGKYRKEDCIAITLPDLRECGVEKIVGCLMGAKDFQPILVDAVCENDILVFSCALLQAIAAGKEFLIRSAASLPKILGNVKSRPLLTREEILGQTDKQEQGAAASGGLVVIGSHVNKTTAQLKSLQESRAPLAFLEFDVNSYHQDGLAAEAGRVLREAELRMTEGKTAVIYTSRRLLSTGNSSGEAVLKQSADISDALTGIVTRLQKRPRFLIAKGGITSSDVGTKGLLVKKALVMGQVKPGIPVWQTGLESRFPGMAYIIFPGNVGENDTLKEVVEMLV